MPIELNGVLILYPGSGRTGYSSVPFHVPPHPALKNLRTDTGHPVTVPANEFTLDGIAFIDMFIDTPESDEQLA